MKENTDISERILQVIDYLKLNPNSFAKSLGYKRSQVVYDILKGKAKPSYEFFNKLTNTEYSERISLRWLISGIGSIDRKNQMPLQANEEMAEYIKHQHKPGVFCHECALRERLIESQNRTILALERTVIEIDKKNNSKQST